MHSVVTRQTQASEFSITVKPRTGEDIQEMFRRLAATVTELDAKIVHLSVFGSIQARATGREAQRRIFRKIEWPVTWVEGAACTGGPVAGIQVFALAGGAVHPITVGNEIIGSVFEDGSARHCVLGGLGPRAQTGTRAQQTTETLENLERALSQGGFAMGDTVRTWFYLDDLLSWYGDFNATRNRFYSGVKFRTGSLPVSTGVAGRNPAGAALVLGAWAIQPAKPATRIEEVASPLQCPAPAYGSAFSRAMEIASPAGRRMLISGTASIAPDGKTLWPGEVRKQVAVTMEVVEAILRSRGYKMSNLTRATAYFKHRGDAPVFMKWCAENGLESLPVVPVHCDICRDDLLFELEADAWRSCLATD